MLYLCARWGPNIGCTKCVYLKICPLLLLFTHPPKYIMPCFPTNFQRTLKFDCDVHLFVLGLSHCYYILYPQQKLTLTCPFAVYHGLGCQGKILLCIFAPLISLAFLFFSFFFSEGSWHIFWALGEIPNTSRHSISSWKPLTNLECLPLFWFGSFHWQMVFFYPRFILGKSKVYSV